MKNTFQEIRYRNMLAGSRILKGTLACLGAGVMLCISGGVTSVFAMQPQIPSLQHCNKTKVEGRAKVHIGCRSDAVLACLASSWKPSVIHGQDIQKERSNS